ncbi:hypothetical protein QJS10_CPB11g02251 [Acorus calamus]|uniref:Helicase MAGATAMA 3 n=1 Tax=Acorus calamus TaxID=4465 RepID=A0AAV9DTC3_ACOCL|nr:hypothetical protein QJS10_CPB11g02251 [Acorus calamus]
MGEEMKRGEGKGKEKREWDLLDVVFSWSFDNILDQSLFYDRKVEKIPMTFRSVDLYLKSYIKPLLEETRAELCSSLQSFTKLPFTETRHVETKSLRKGHYIITVDDRPDHHKNYVPKTGDLFALSDVKPSQLSSHPNKLSKSCVLCFVMRGPGDDENLPSCCYQIKASKAIEEGNYGKWLKRPRQLFAVSLMNVITNSRIWVSLNLDVWTTKRNLSIIKRVLCTNFKVPKDCELCSSDSSAAVDGDMNESQLSAVSSCVSASQCAHENQIRLIWGPPGTGKTNTTAFLLRALQRMKCKTLTCAPTNVAVLEVASRFLRLVVGDPSPKGWRAFRLGDVALFGNRDRMEVNDFELVQHVFLENRAKKLSLCFPLRTGWRHRIASMTDLLEDGVSQYRIHSEKNNECPTFKSFVRWRFRAVSESLIECLETLWTHLPSSSISETDFENIATACDLLRNLDKWLHKTKLSKTELERLFTLSAEGDETPKFESDEPLKFTECLSILKGLLDTLKLPKSSNEPFIVNYCLERATLIFCTVCCSAKLHRFAMEEPLKILVIDEAAQLKECEAFIPLQIPGIQHAILIGDERQLPAMVHSKSSEKAGFGKSLFERLSSLDHKKHLLNVQYRMHPSISRFPNEFFYENKILDGPNVLTHKSYRMPQYLAGRMYGTYSFINIDGKKHWMSGTAAG